MNDGILTIVGDLITAKRDADIARYSACSCADCKRRLAETKEFFDIGRDELVTSTGGDDCKAGREPARTRVCYGCLRDFNSGTGRCPYCGTKNK